MQTLHQKKWKTETARAAKQQLPFGRGISAFPHRDIGFPAWPEDLSCNAKVIFC